MSPEIRKLNLTAHVTSSVGWFGALLVFLAHAIASVATQDEALQRAACIAMGLTAWFVILPLSFASLVTGIVQAVSTAWGLVRHYWVVAKLLLTVFATAILLLKLAPISDLSEAARAPIFNHATLLDLKMSMTVHAVGGLVILLVAIVLAIYKPAGLTPFARWRLRNVARDADGSAALSTPAWVRTATWISLVGALLLVLMLLHGGHGPGMHGLHG